MPVGAETTRPPPSPRMRTVKVSITTANDAEMAVASERSSSQTIPVQLPPKPEKANPSAALASRRTRVPTANVEEHVRLQSSPAGLDGIVPWPLTVKASATWRSRKVAEATASDDSARSHDPVPPHAPDHPS